VPISSNGKVLGIDEVIYNYSNFNGFSIFSGFMSTGSQNFRFPIDFASHRYSIEQCYRYRAACYE